MGAARATTSAGPRAAAVALAAVSLAGCGHSGRSPAHQVVASPPQACTPAAGHALAGYIGAAPGSISTAAGTSNSSYPQCVFRASGIGVTSIVDTGPQPYFVLERTAIEAGQVFTPTRIVPAPVNLPGLGIEAFWFPVERQLMATDGKVLVTVAVRWPHVSNARRIALGEAIARSYLATSRRRAAAGYPSG